MLLRIWQNFLQRQFAIVHDRFGVNITGPQRGKLCGNGEREHFAGAFAAEQLSLDRLYLR